MKSFETEILSKLKEIESIMDGTLKKEKDFRVKTTEADGETYTYDRESYLELGLEVAQEQLYFLIGELEERVETKSRIKLLKK
ncbi:hypothetical protein C4578_04080 [Candidatus Microgenomates bacterium]|nr:MAG: hypothetical protein C4578_04080 [Candidatus Microgenomates bacterium]